MNTDRDNFHDWARDKPDTTSFSGLHHLERQSYRRPAGIPWGRIFFMIGVAVVAIAGVRHFYPA